MNLYDSYSKLYEEAIETAGSISNPYERATIYTNIMNSIAIMIAGNSNNSCSCDCDSADNCNCKNDETSEPSSTNTIEDTVETTTAEITAIDKASDESDDDEWTEPMLAKYSAEIAYVNEAMEQFEEDELNKFVHDATNGLYSSFAEMGPAPFIATYTLLKQAIEKSV